MCGADELDVLINNLFAQLNNIEKQKTKMNKEIAVIQKKLKKTQSVVGFKRYNAFGEFESDLSFSVAFLNDLHDGIVLTGIYNRGTSNVYAKQVRKGVSSQPLSPEEIEVVGLAQSYIKEQRCSLIAE